MRSSFVRRKVGRELELVSSLQVLSVQKIHRFYAGQCSWPDLLASTTVFGYCLARLTKFVNSLAFLTGKPLLV